MSIQEHPIFIEHHLPNGQVADPWARARHQHRYSRYKNCTQASWRHQTLCQTIKYCQNNHWSNTLQASSKWSKEGIQRRNNIKQGHMQSFKRRTTPHKMEIAPSNYPSCLKQYHPPQEPQLHPRILWSSISQGRIIKTNNRQIKREISRSILNF